jgi:hypothetical protein
MIERQNNRQEPPLLERRVHVRAQRAELFRRPDDYGQSLNDKESAACLEY